jgi:hypothetical protein
VTDAWNRDAFVHLRFVDNERKAYPVAAFEAVGNISNTCRPIPNARRKLPHVRTPHGARRAGLR